MSTSVSCYIRTVLVGLASDTVAVEPSRIIPGAFSAKAYVGDIKCTQNETGNKDESTTQRFFTPMTFDLASTTPPFSIGNMVYVPVEWNSLAVKLLM